MVLVTGKEDELVFRYPQEENPDWGYARNRQFVLKETGSCWSSSFFSVEMDGFTMPNRDYPQQGLVSRIGNEYVKFLDAPMFKLMHSGEKLDLEPVDVEVTPWEATYIYQANDATLEVTYYLSPSTLDRKTGGWVKFEVDTELEDLELIVSPLVDIRKIGEKSPDPDEYLFQAKKGRLHVSRNGRKLILGTCEDSVDVRERESWEYKLGDGYREVKDDEVVFKSETRHPLKAGAVTKEVSGGGEVKIGLVCGEEVDETDLDFFKESSPRTQKKRLKELMERFDLPEEGVKSSFAEARLATLTKFSMKEGGMEVPEAGEWWFKDVWFRDLFESIYHNTDFYIQWKGENWLKKLFNWARIYIKDGVMASKAGDEPVYNSIDASLLYLLCVSKFFEKTGDKYFKKNMRKTFDSVINSLESDDGLVRSRPEYSWMDSVVDGRSTRIPESWDLEGNNFLLPEVNALWIKVLEEYNKIYGEIKDVRSVWNSFKQTFWDEKKGFLYQVVYRDGEIEKKDGTESSAAVVSLGLLREYFLGYELLKAWKVIKDRLLVYRKPVYFNEGYIPFGILVKNSKKKVYLGDEQYHEAVVWPRDNPYLFKLLEKIDRTKVMENINKNILDHQMSEGAIFYNQELFSLPEGGNPCETSLSSNPVPVKNPVQLWSHYITDIAETKGC